MLRKYKLIHVDIYAAFGYLNTSFVHVFRMHRESTYYSLNSSLQQTNIDGFCHLYTTPSDISIDDHFSVFIHSIIAWLVQTFDR